MLIHNYVQVNDKSVIDAADSKRTNRELISLCTNTPTAKSAVSVGTSKHSIIIEIIYAVVNTQTLDTLGS